MLGIGYTDEIVHEINNDIETMRANKKIIIILERLYKDFDTIII
jgi:hypothetical protein